MYAEPPYGRREKMEDAMTLYAKRLRLLLVAACLSANVLHGMLFDESLEPNSQQSWSPGASSIQAGEEDSFLLSLLPDHWHCSARDAGFANVYGGQGLLGCPFPVISEDEIRQHQRTLRGEEGQSLCVEGEEQAQREVILKQKQRLEAEWRLQEQLMVGDFHAVNPDTGDTLLHEVSNSKQVRACP